MRLSESSLRDESVSLRFVLKFDAAKLPESTTDNSGRMGLIDRHEANRAKCPAAGSAASRLPAALPVWRVQRCDCEHQPGDGGDHARCTDGIIGAQPQRAVA